MLGKKLKPEAVRNEKEGKRGKEKEEKEESNIHILLIGGKNDFLQRGGGGGEMIEMHNIYTPGDKCIPTI